MTSDSLSSNSTPRSFGSYNSEVDVEVEVDVNEKSSLVLKKTDYKKVSLHVDPNEVMMKPIEFIMIILGSLGAIGIGCTPLAFYYFFGQLIAETATEPPSEQEDSIQRTSYLFFLMAVIACVCAFFQNYCYIFAGERFAARIRKELFKAISRQEIAFFDSTTTGELSTKLSEECQQIRDAFSDKTGQLFTAFAQFVCGISFAFYYSWELTLVMMAVAPFMGVVIVGQGIFLVKYTKATASSSQNAMGVATEVISNFRTVRSFSTEEKEIGRFDNKLIDLVNTARKRATAQGIGMGLIQLMVWGACGVAFWFGGYLVGQSELNFGDLVTVFGMMLFACLGLSVGFAALPELVKGRASYNRIKGLIHRVPEIPFSGGNTLPSVEGNVEFENVNFRYKSRDIEVLRDVSFRVPQGKTVAFVGESGSGKSTIFSLIERFYEAGEGRILIDGHDIRSLDPRWLHKHVAIVSQEPVLFATTIAENISYTKDGATLSDIISAAKAANAHDFISALPDGYNTMVGERGVQLSGGQKQRVAIARAILANPRILLLDEATSALDTESEQLVQEALDRLMHNRTSLCIAHRLATVRNADTIFVLMKGRIVARGTHEELLESSDDYSNLARRQLSLHN